MNCDDVHSRLLELRDGILEEPAVSMVHAHLQDCAVCRREWEQDGRLDSLLELLRMLDLSDETEWPVEKGAHLDAVTLEGLAEYSGGPLTDEQRSQEAFCGKQWYFKDRICNIVILFTGNCSIFSKRYF